MLHYGCRTCWMKIKKKKYQPKYGKKLNAESDRENQGTMHRRQWVRKLHACGKCNVPHFCHALIVHGAGKTDNTFCINGFTFFFKYFLPLLLYFSVHVRARRAARASLPLSLLEKKRVLYERKKKMAFGVHIWTTHVISLWLCQQTDNIFNQKCKWHVSSKCFGAPFPHKIERNGKRKLFQRVVRVFFFFHSIFFNIKRFYVEILRGNSFECNKIRLKVSSLFIDFLFVLWSFKSP